MKCPTCEAIYCVEDFYKFCPYCGSGLRSNRSQEKQTGECLKCLASGKKNCPDHFGELTEAETRGLAEREQARKRAKRRRYRANLMARRRQAGEVRQAEEPLVQTTGADGFNRRPISEPCQPYEGGGCYRATKLEKRLAEHYYTRHEIDERFRGFLDALDPIPMPCRLRVTGDGTVDCFNDLRRRFLDGRD